MHTISATLEGVLHIAIDFMKAHWEDFFEIHHVNAVGRRDTRRGESGGLREVERKRWIATKLERGGERI